MKISEGLLTWLLSKDTGVSSKNIVKRNFGLPLGQNMAFGYPYDGDDFGRCYRMLKIAPEIKIERMKGFNRIWDDLVDAWPELSIMYEQNNGMDIHGKISQITEKYSKNHCTTSEDVLYGPEIMGN